MCDYAYLQKVLPFCVILVSCSAVTTRNHWGAHFGTTRALVVGMSNTATAAASDNSVSEHLAWVRREIAELSFPPDSPWTEADLSETGRDELRKLRRTELRLVTWDQPIEERMAALHAFDRHERAVGA